MRKGRPKKGMEARKSPAYFRRNEQMRGSSRGQAWMQAEEDKDVSRNHTLKNILFWLYFLGSRQGILLRGH